MSKRGENIFRRKDGRWEARYVRERDSSGKIRYGFCYGKTYREAKDKAARMRALPAGVRPAPSPGDERRFSCFCEEWLRLSRGRIRESTYVKYEAALRRYILPRLGGYLPAEITAQTAEAFKADLLNGGLSAQSAKNILIELRAILNYTALHCPPGLPQVRISYPKEPKKEMRVLSREEQKRLTDYLYRDMDSCKFGTFLALMTGMRIGEVCALRWGDLSVKNRTVHIGATLQRLKNLDGMGSDRTSIRIGTPKSGTSVRTIPLTEETARICGRHDPGRPDAYILTGTEEYMEPRRLQRRLEKYGKECGLEGIHFHTLRHTFATRCMEAGFELKSLSEILGHASTSTTLDLYVHSSLELKRENMEKLAAHL